MFVSCNALIVGAGPAGLAAGIGAANVFRENVYVLEKNACPGRKFLLSGSGQCNVTHGGPIVDFFDHYGDRKKGRFVAPALLDFDNRATIRFFEEHDVPMWEREDGKVFPRSLKSKDLLDVLHGELLHWGGELRTETTVRSVEYRNGEFFVQTEREHFRTEKLVLAVGGKSYPKTGSTGDGFRWAEQLGHRIVPPRPALTPFDVKNYPFSESAGIAFRQVAIEIRRSGRRLRTGRGDVLLTHRGLSGPGILDLSRWIEADDEFRIALLAEPEELRNLLVGKKTLKNALVPLGIPERFLVQLLETLDILPDRPASEISRDERKQLEAALSGFPFIVKRLGDWNEAMTTTGGVALEEVDRKTMESRIVPGLFFCGEVLDVDGDCGGYNIQFALSSGKLAASPPSMRFWGASAPSE